MGSIAITTTFDITEGKAIRKLEPGEALEVMEEEKQDEKRKLSRVKVKATRDDLEGWITIKGNQGTAYVEPNEKLFEILQNMPLEAQLTCGSTTVRTLEKGELFDVTVGPKPDTKEGKNRVKGRNLSDGS